ncbi:MAG: hypothetical protein QOJ16_2029 [Acidobacteriota bacterium]|jgi:hypothetical protein|nr:hypothetical protein [Acidobacteriota bacterium]
MSFKRVHFEGDIFPRHTETDEEWQRSPGRGQKAIAHGSMEIFGETRPLALAQDPPEEGKPASTYLHEYAWNVGLTGYELEWIEKLQEDDAVLVQVMVLPGRSPFISREIFATLEYLPPTRNIPYAPGLLHWTKALASGIGKVADGLNVPVVGMVGSLVSDLVPPERAETKWFLNKFALPGGGEDASCYGIEWHISRGLIHEIGSRLVGRLGLAFINAPWQDEKPEAAEDSLVLRGRFGLRLARTPANWFDFSLVPGSGSEALSLRLKPQRGGAPDVH